MEPRATERPSAKQFSVQKLVEMAAKGALRIPEWQRLFKWKNKNIKDLLDSLEKGFPIGTLLLWKRPTPAPAGNLALGPHTFTVRESAEAFWVIDGRQRITTLAGVFLLRGPPDRDPDARDDFTWAYDLATGNWVNPRKGEAWRTEWLPADRLVDATDLVAWLLSHGDVLTAQMKNRANAIARDIREYEVPAVIVSADSDDTLRLIFHRMNNAGVRLEANETFDALQGALTTPAPSTMRGLADISVELGFGELDQDWLLRLLIQVSGGDFTRVTHETLVEKVPPESIRRTAEALRRALAFMRSDVGIPNEALLPYRLPVAVLTVFFDRHARPRPRSLELLSRWVWRGAVLGDHQGENIPWVRSLFAVIDDDEEATVQRLLASSSRRAHAFPSFGPVNTRTAVTRLEILALLSLGPRDLESGAAFDGPALIAASKTKALHHVVSHLPGGEEGSLERTLVNRVLQLPERRAVGSHLAGAPEDWAASHGVGRDAQKLLADQQFEAFLETRRAQLLRIFRDFIESKTKFDEPDRPSIASLIVEDES